MGDASADDGFMARAGALTLLYLCSPMERSALLTMVAEMTTNIALQEIEEPEPEFLRMGIFEDSYLLEPADPDHPPGAPIDEQTMLRPTPAGREIPLVGASLARWLARCPSGPLTLGPKSASQMEAMLGGWCSAVTHAVAAGPRSVEQVQEAIQVLDLAMVERRMEIMTENDLLEPAPGGEPGEPQRFRATPWLRRSVGPLFV